MLDSLAGGKRDKDSTGWSGMGGSGCLRDNKEVGAGGFASDGGNDAFDCTRIHTYSLEFVIGDALDIFDALDGGVNTSASALK